MTRALSITRVLTLALAAAVPMSLASTHASAQALFDDGNGRIWAQPRANVGLSWQGVAQICPIDGSGACTGAIGTHDLTGWHWATEAEVLQLFSYWVPEILSNPNLQSPGYTAPALFFLGTFLATQSQYSTYSNYEYVGGLTATRRPDGLVVGGGASATWPVFSGSFAVLPAFSATESSAAVGLWLWRSSAASSCPGDCGGDGAVGLADIADVINHWSRPASAAPAPLDMDGSGTIDLGDVAVILNHWGTACG